MVRLTISNWYFMHDRYKKADPAPLSYKRWLRDTTDYIDYLYDVVSVAIT